MVGEKWEVTPYHAWAALGWVVAAAMTACAIWLGSERLAWAAIFVIAVVVTYNICASIRAGARSQFETFQLGREHERTQADVLRLR